MKSKVMVTGASGWLGRRLVNRLAAEKREIVCVDYFKDSQEFPEFSKNKYQVKIVDGDIRNPEKFADEFSDCETVFNCAGLQHPTFTSDLYSVNRDAPASLLKLCIASNVKNFVHVSSAIVHGENIGKSIITEKTPFRPLTHYGISKAQGEDMLVKLGKNSKVKTTIIRPAAFYGMNPSKNLVQLVMNVQKNFAIVFGDKGFLRTYVDIEKVVDSILLAEKYGRNCEAYLVGDKKPITTLQLYQYIADELGVKLKVIKLPKLLSRLSEKVSFAAGKINIHLRIPNIMGEFGRIHYFSSEKAARQIRYKPNESPEKGLRAMTKSVIRK